MVSFIPSVNNANQSNSSMINAEDMSSSERSNLPPCSPLLSPNTAAASTSTSSNTGTTAAIASAAASSTPLLPIKVTCLVKANDTSEENILHSDRIGLRFRHILSNASETVASFSKSIVEENEFVKYVQAVCQDFTKYCNCDLTLCYGDGKKTTVMMRYLDEPYKSSPVVKDKIMMFVRLVEKSDVAISSSTSSSSTTTTVLRAKESIYKHISLGTCSQGVQEVYIAPSSCTLYDIFNKNNNDDESIILMSVKNNQVQSPVEINPSHHRIKEFTSHDVFICINGDDDGGDDIVVDFESAVGSTSMKRSGGNNVESETMGAEKFLSPKRNRNSSSNSGGGGGGSSGAGAGAGGVVAPSSWLGFGIAAALAGVVHGITMDWGLWMGGWGGKAGACAFVGCVLYRCWVACWISVLRVVVGVGMRRGGKDRPPAVEEVVVQQQGRGR
mmetsp:Transcript_14511/g.27301  ORF Transcript_14511/g.27301 Transcript_14511/m.27301 type:complete len:443 (-) Transcript_14511:85-1413(-)